MYHCGCHGNPFTLATWYMTISNAPNMFLRSLQPLFTKVVKSHVFAQFFVRVFVSGWYTYIETAQVLFSLYFREKGVKTLKIYE